MSELSLVILMIAAVVNSAIGVLNYINIRQVHVATNSMKDELVAVTRSDARQEGITEGVAIAKAKAKNGISG